VSAEIPGSSIAVRAVTSGDVGACLDIYAPIVRESSTSFETEIPSIDEFARRIRESTRDYPWLVAELPAERGARSVAGYAYARRHRGRAAYRWSTEVSVYVAGGLRRCGIGRRLYEELFDILRRQGYYNAYAGIALPNPTSVVFHESLGFVPVGVYEKAGYKLGRWHDVGWWALRLKPDDEEPIDPIPYSDLV